MDITGKSEDEVATALFDCGWDETKAIELLIEEGGGLGSWEETGKKKKKKQETANRDDKDAGRENEDWDTDNFDPTNNARQQQQENDNRDRSRNRGPPRFKRGGGAGPPNAGRSDRDGGVDQQWKHRELQENERNFAEGSGRGRGGGGAGVGRGGARSSRGGGSIGGGLPPRQRGRGGGPRQYSGPDRGERGGGGVGGAGVVTSGTSDAGPFGQMDTWNPVGEEGGAANSSAGGRRGKISSRDAFDNAGTGSDLLPLLKVPV
jgi:hypothetical protein